MKIRLGTKDSTLALLRAQELVALLEERGHEVEVIRLPNVGDRESIGQLRLGLLRDDFDVVIHRMNRVPDGHVPGVVLGAVPARGDRRDVFIGRDGKRIAGLLPGARVSVAMPLRRAQLNRRRDDLELVDLRPDLEGCLDKVKAGELEGVLCSAADVAYLERLDEISEYLDWVPAPGQGALGYECREYDTEMLAILEEFHDADTRISVMAERAVAESLNLSDKASLGARAGRSGVLSLRADVIPHDDTKPVSLQLGMPTSEFHATRCGHRLAQALKLRGVEQIGRDPEPEPLPAAVRRIEDVSEMRVLVAREEGRMSVGLRSAGIKVDAIPLQERFVLNTSSTLDGADWIAFTSTRAVASIRELGWVLPRDARIAAVGPGTAEALEAMGYTVDLVPPHAAGVNALLDVWPDGEGRVFVPGSALLAPSFIARLQGKGYTAQLVPVYTMQTLPRAPEDLRRAWTEHEYDAVIISSGSNALAVGDLLGWTEEIPIVAVGESAIAVLERSHIPVAKSCLSYQPQEVVERLRELVAEQPAD